MKIDVFKTGEELAREAGREVAALVRSKPDCVLGLATGSSPLGTYAELSRLHAEEGLSFASCTSVNLDEYLGLGGSDPHSYRHFMEKNLFSRIDIRRERTFVPDGTAADPAAECAAYDARIERLGGIDLQILGIGPDGHIGFNEPADFFVRETHVVSLDQSTIRANSRFFESEGDVPRRALTMGIGGIFGAKRILLLLSGEAKMETLRRALGGPITPRLPASILQLHPCARALWSER